MSTPLFVAILALSAVVSSFISGILGMAGGMILMGVLLAMMPVPAAMMLHGITQFAANGWRAFLWRDSVDWRVFRQYLLQALASLHKRTGLGAELGGGVGVAGGVQPGAEAQPPAATH